MRELFLKISFFITLISIEYLATTSRHFEVVEKSWDKLNHFFAFFVLYLLFSFGFKNLKALYKIFFLMMFGLQIELVQHFLPFREFSLLDIFADGVGVFMGYYLKKAL